MRIKLRPIVLFVAVFLCLAFHTDARQASTSDSHPIACRVLEAHASAHPAVAVVVFHQRDQADQARMAEMLRQRSGGVVEVQTSDGEWTSATVVRLKSCFGRGLLIMSADAPQMKDGATFLLRLAPDNDKN